MTRFSAWLNSILMIKSVLYIKKYCNILALKVLQYHMQY